MPKAVQVSNYFNFVGGINTEANPLTPVENTCTDMLNVDLLIDGSLRKRLSFEDLTAAATAPTGAAPVSVDTPGKAFEWDNSPLGDLVSIYNASGKIQFVPRNIAGTHISTANTITVSGYSGTIISATSVAGIFVFITRNANGLRFMYAVQIPTGTALGGTTITQVYPVFPKVRNTTRMYQGNAFDYRTRCPVPSRIGTIYPTPIGASVTDVSNHGIDLQNSGWTNRTLVNSVALIGVNLVASSGAILDFIGPGMPAGTTAGTPLVYYNASGAALGSGSINSVVSAPNEKYLVNGLTNAILQQLSFVWVQVPGSTGLLPSRYDNPRYLVDDTINPPKINLAAWNNSIGATPEVPLGRFKQSLDLTGISSITTTLRRVWLAKNSSIYFSRVIRTAHSSSGTNPVSIQDIQTFVSDIATMHMKNDPTDSALFDLLPDDGGDLQISEAGKILHIEPTGAGVLVFATKGVWAIQGTPGQAFTATDYTVKKLTSIPIVNGVHPKDLVQTTSAGIAYVSQEGIIVLKSEDGYNYTAANLTMPTINRLYNGIPAQELENATLLYDGYEKELKLLYGRTATNPYYSNILIYDLRLSAWYRTSMSTGIGIYSTYDSVHFGASNGASSIHFVRYDTASSKLFEVMQTGNLGSGDLTGAFPYPAYIETKAEQWADGFRDKQIDYMAVFCRYTPQAKSSIRLSTKWDWAVDPLSNKYFDVGEVYKLDKYQRVNQAGALVDNSYEVIATKHKVRGTGKAIVLRFDIDQATPGHILGWSILVSGNSVV